MERRALELCPRGRKEHLRLLFPEVAFQSGYDTSPSASVPIGAYHDGVPIGKDPAVAYGWGSTVLTHVEPPSESSIVPSSHVAPAADAQAPVPTPVESPSEPSLVPPATTPPTDPALLDQLVEKANLAPASGCPSAETQNGFVEAPRPMTDYKFGFDGTGKLGWRQLKTRGRQKISAHLLNPSMHQITTPCW